MKAQNGTDRRLHSPDINTCYALVASLEAVEWRLPFGWTGDSVALTKMIKEEGEARIDLIVELESVIEGAQRGPRIEAIGIRWVRSVRAGVMISDPQLPGRVFKFTHGNAPGWFHQESADNILAAVRKAADEAAAEELRGLDAERLRMVALSLDSNAFDDADPLVKALVTSLVDVEMAKRLVEKHLTKNEPSTKKTNADQ